MALTKSRANDRLRWSQAGDTIVEVMIVLAILGFAIGIAYATANHSLLGARRAQETTEATELLQSQVESLRYLAASGGSGPLSVFQSGPFCIDTTPQVVTGFTHTPEPDPADTNYTGYPAACVNSFYHIAINYKSDYDGDGNADDTFILTATWDDVEGHGQDSTSLTYRIHP